MKTPKTGFSFAAAGDLLFGPKFDSSLSVLRASGANFYLALGDLAYGSTSEQNWCETFKREFDNVVLVTGNHESGEVAGDGNINAYLEYCPFTLGTLTGTYGKEFFFDYPTTKPLARFILISPGVNMAIDGTGTWSYSQGDPHYNFVAKAISEARAANIPWVIVGMHKNCISSGAQRCEISADLWNLLMEEKVDLVLQGHDHNYQRSKQLACWPPGTYESACVVNDTGQYVKGQGTVLVIQGTWGAPLAAINSTDPEFGYFVKTHSSANGFLTYTVTIDKIDARFVRTSGDTFSDSFSISRPGAESLSQTPFDKGTQTMQTTRELYSVSPSTWKIGRTEQIEP